MLYAAICGKEKKLKKKNKKETELHRKAKHQLFIKAFVYGRMNIP